MNSELLLSFLIMIPTWVMLLPIGICSVLLLAVIIERTIFFRLWSAQMSGPVKMAVSHINSGKNKAALTLLKKQNNLLSQVLIQFLEIDDEKLKESYVDESAHIAISRMERYSGLVSTIATVSPMFGLLGTVTGMMKSFSALSAASSQAQNMLANGIAEALVTTATGLVVGIPAVIFYNYMVTRSGYLMKQLEIALNSISEE